MIYPWLSDIWRTLLAQRERTHHALLLHGPAGIGKSRLAAELTRAWLCESPEAGGEACGRCASCGWVAHDNHPDLRVLAPMTEEPSEAATEGTTRTARATPSTDIRIDQDNMIIISPDEGGMGKCMYYSAILGLDLGNERQFPGDGVRVRLGGHWVGRDLTDARVGAKDRREGLGCHG